MKTEAGCEKQQFTNVKYFLKDCLLMESVTRASKAPQKHCLVQAAVPKKLRNDNDVLQKRWECLRHPWQAT